jgi:hypothetical protein
MSAEQDDKLKYGGDIEEHQGKVPLWLIITYIALTAWAVYYMIKYWGGPGLGDLLI